MMPALISALWACGNTPPPQPPPEPTPVVQEDPGQGESFLRVMRLHFALATEARTAVIRGDLPAAQRAGKLLSQMGTPEVPAGSEPHMVQMKAEARRLAGAQTLLDAGEAIGSLAVTCGKCHQQTTGGPRPQLDSLEKANAPVPEGHMKQHMWCLEHMWLGLVGPSPELFTRGAKVLGETQTHQPEEVELDEEQITLEAQVHELASAAAATEALDQRAKLFGHFIGNCASCHTTAGVEPALSPD